MDVKLQNEKQKMFISNILQNSSVPSISKIGNSETKPRKLFWLFVLVICTFGCIFKVYDFLYIYLQYPVLVDLEVQRNLKSDFPAVTVCSLNRVDSMYVDCVREATPFWECMQPVADDFLPELFLSETTLLFTAAQANLTSKVEWYKESADILSGFSELTVESRKLYGYQYYEIITKCMFQSKECGETNFTLFLNLQYGNCYTFNNLKDTEGDNSRMSSLGEDSGLELELDMLSGTYLDITESVGARIIVHSPHQDPNPSVDGISILPGYESQLSVSKTSIKRLPPPYRDRCFNYDVKSNDSFLKSEHDCSTACIQKSNFIKCSCTDPLLPHFDSYKTCSLKNESELSCLSMATKEIIQGSLPCKCSVPCVTTDYKVAVSASRISPFSKQKARVKIFYGNLDHIVYSQKPAYTQAEMLAHIGGILGLWLGLSAFAIFENIEKIILLIKHFSKNRKILK